MASKDQAVRVGIVGYGSLGQYLAKALLQEGQQNFNGKKFELAFVWNRTLEKVKADLPEHFVLEDLDKFAEKKANLIVEVAHPTITRSHGVQFLKYADYFIGSPTALADPEIEAALRQEANNKTGFGLYVPCGALWGIFDIEKMVQRKTLKGLTITMKKAPHHFKLEPPLSDKLKEAENKAGETVLYSGPVRQLCSMAPNNVNTMAAACIAASNLGFDGVTGVLVADPKLDKHVTEVDVRGPGAETNPDTGFRVFTQRTNPAPAGSVTGTATYSAFLSSMTLANGKGDGVHLC